MALINRPPTHPGSAHDHYLEEARPRLEHDVQDASLRALGMGAGGVAVAFGVVAILRIDWTQGLNSASVGVGGAHFTPAVAIATAALGLLVFSAGAAVDRASKLIVGTGLVSLGLAVLLAGSSRAMWDVDRGHGLLALVIGLVLVLTGSSMHRPSEQSDIERP